MADLELQPPVPESQGEKGGVAEPGDARSTFQELSLESRGTEIPAEFIASKVRLVHSHPQLSPDERESALHELAERFGILPEVLKKEGPPVPGGVGYGEYYTTAYKGAFAQGTSLYFQIVCPNPPGGNVNNWLYLTAMNRAGMGIEAFVSYYQQTIPHFKVFDWARTSHWQIDIPFGNLGNYLAPATAHGKSYQILSVWNTTNQLSSGQWRNEAWLWNKALGRWDLIYQYDYAASQGQQTGGFTGSWGPIVETFQPTYSQTKPMGFLQTQLTSRGGTGAWGAWQLLSPVNSYIQNGNQGFNPSFLDPNYAFVVTS